MTEYRKNYRELPFQHPAELVDETIHSLKTMAQAGCSGFDCTAKALEAIERWGQIPDDAASPSAENSLAGVETLKDIRVDLGDCRRCKLCKGRRTIVFGQGSENARLVFVGEGPGAEEDRQGLVFVGAAGQLLTKIIRAIKMTREEVYICNIVKCRPPGNRNPQPDEINACAPFLRRQIEAIAPDYICTLGSFASKTLLETDTPVTRLRGRLHDYMGIKLLPTYHPAFLLRNPDRKRDVWEDMQLLMGAMGIAV